MKVEKQHTSVELENFFYLRLKDATFLASHNSCVCCKWKVQQGGELKTLKYLQKASLAWRLVSLLLNSPNTAVLVLKLRSPQCLLTPIFTLMTSFFSFFS